MLNLFEQTTVYFACDPVDMRRQIDGLALQVQEVMDLNPFDSVLFAFCNRRRDKFKILFWHNNGFCLLYKRLEKGQFFWPSGDEAVVCLSLRELKWLLEGLSLSDLKTHQKLPFTAV